MAKIFKLSQKAMDNGMSWDEAIYNNEIDTIEDGFESIWEAQEEFDRRGYDTDFYGVG